MGGFRLDAGGYATVVELLYDPLRGASFSRRGGRPLDCSQSLDPAKSLFARVSAHDGNLRRGRQAVLQVSHSGRLDGPDLLQRQVGADALE